MKYRTLRHIASVVLLAAYLPMVLLSSLHIHHETVDISDDCTQCAGHIESHHQHNSDCQYCHFLSLDYLGEAGGLSEATTPGKETIAIAEPSPMVLPSYGVSLMRAPPVA